MTVKPGRPFGVTLAIIASVLLFAVIPLLQIGMVLIVENHFRNLDNTITLPSGEVLEGFSGGDFRGGISDERIILQGVTGIIFIGIALLAWRGRPPYIRYIMLVSVLVLTGIALAFTIIPSLLNRNASTSGGSLDILTTPLLCLQLALHILIPVYVVWYLNRAPARAFYRGYYLQQNAHQSTSASYDPAANVG